MAHGQHPTGRIGRRARRSCVTRHARGSIDVPATSCCRLSRGGRRDRRRSSAPPDRARSR
jgi:hypothetical protein